MGERPKQPFQLSFNTSLKVDFQGSRVTSDARLILCAGRLSPEKNLDILVQALDKVLVERPHCVAVLFGDGELRPGIQSRVEMARAHARIRLLGYTNELWSWIQRASVFVSISRFEGNPNAVLEAMAVGCPLVVSSHTAA